MDPNLDPAATAPSSPPPRTYLSLIARFWRSTSTAYVPMAGYPWWAAILAGLFQALTGLVFALSMGHLSLGWDYEFMNWTMDRIFRDCQRQKSDPTFSSVWTRYQDRVRAHDDRTRQGYGMLDGEDDYDDGDHAL